MTIKVIRVVIAATCNNGPQDSAHGACVCYQSLCTNDGFGANVAVVAAHAMRTVVDVAAVG